MDETVADAVQSAEKAFEMADATPAGEQAQAPRGDASDDVRLLYILSLFVPFRVVLDDAHLICARFARKER